MLGPSFHIRKTKNMLGDYHTRKLAGRHRFRDVSHIKFSDIFKSLRRRRLRSGVSPQSALTHSRSFPPPLADHHSSPIHSCPPDPFVSSSARYRSDTVSILSVTEEDCSSGMSISSTSSEGNLAGGECHLLLRPIPAFPTSPSVFRLRPASAADYLVDGLEQHLRQLSLGDRGLILESSCLSKISIRQDVPTDPGTSPHRTLYGSHAQKSIALSHDQNVVPIIFITSVDAKHSKPLPPSSQRPKRTPFGPSNVIDSPPDIHAMKFKPTILPDDPFRTPPHGTAYTPDYNLTFQLPTFPSTSSTSEYSPETPTPMCCDHLGNCKGDMWEVLHPPLVAGKFTLPPFEFPPMSTGFFDDIPSSLPC